MTKRIAGALAVAGVIAASAFGRLPSTAVARQLGASAQENSLAYTDYVDDSSGTVTRVLPSSATRYDYLQMTPDGTARDAIVQLTPVQEFEPREEDDEIPLATGDVRKLLGKTISTGTCTDPEISCTCWPTTAWRACRR